MQPQLTSDQSTPAGVLYSVAQLTGQRDRDLLAKTMVRTLSELIHSNMIAMYLLLPTDLGLEAILMAKSATAGNIQSAEINLLISNRPDFKSVVDSGTSSLRELDAHNCLSIYPVTDKDKVVGLLEINSHPHSELDRHLISSFLLVYSNYLSLLNESETDTLTGLLNRRTFENNFERIIAERQIAEGAHLYQNDRRSNYGDNSHWLAIMDIDHFKRINDEYGHLYGDEVLLLLSRIMKRIFRLTDKLFRFGGEEFIVVLDRTNLTNAKIVLDRFRAEIESSEFPQVGRVTISIGFVCLDKPDVPSSIIGRADQALYFAKQHGRNQVCFYDDLIASGNLRAENFSDDIQLF